MRNTIGHLTSSPKGNDCSPVCLQSLVSFCQFVLKILSKNQILISIKGCNSVGKLRKTMIYNTNVGLVNDNVYTNLVLIGLYVFKILSKN